MLVSTIISFNVDKGENMSVFENNKNKWSKDELLSLYKYKFEDGKTHKEIAELLGKTEGGVNLKARRTDWDTFTEDPEGYLSGGNCSRKWTQVDMAQLYAFLQSGKSYAEISDELKRSYIAVERKAQTTNWKAWKAAVGDPDSPKSDIANNETIKAQLAGALVCLARHDKQRLNNINEKEFQRKINLDENLPVSFGEIKIEASKQLDSLGFGNPEVLELGEGTYIIVGDSHGKFTKTNMFHLIKEVESAVKPSKIIHIGHLLDDDNDISYNWGKFKNLVVVAKIEELKFVQDQRNKYDFKYNVVRGGVQLGSTLLITNQDMISDYVKNPLSTLDSQIFDDQVVVNCHRLEMMPKCSEDGSSYIASPGCICERHINNTIRQIDFVDGKTVKQAFYGGFSKYRRMTHMYKYWDQGLIVVHVDKNGNHSIIPCLIRKIGSSFVTSYFDKIITSEGVRVPDKKIFVTADMHSPNQDNNVLDVQEQICKDYAPHAVANVGDSHDYRSLNHHEMDRGIVITQNILDESAQVYSALKRMSKWAKERYIIYGNHERFATDFVSKFPQFGNYLDFKFLCSLDHLGYKHTDLKKVLKIGPTKFIHGDLTMYGQPGSKLEKSSRTFCNDGENIFVGHIHYPAIRFGSYSVGLCGKLDQTYNEPSASAWIHGFGLCNQYRGLSFPTTVAIIDNRCIINGKKYSPKNPESWNVKKYSVKLVYEMAD